MNETQARRVAVLAGEAVSGPDRSGWFDRLESDRGVLAEAVSWYLDRDDADTALRIVIDVSGFWELRGHLTEGRRIIETALERGSRADQGLRGRAYVAAVVLAFRQGDNDTAASLVETVLALARSADDQRAISTGLLWSARVARRRSEHEVARQRLEEAVAIAAALGDVRAMIEPLHSLATGEKLAGNYAEARKRYEETRALSEQIGNTRGAMIETMNLAAVELLIGDAEAAARGAKQALRWARDTKDTRAIPPCLSILGGVARLRGEGERAATLLGAAEAALVRGQAAFDPDDSAMHAEQVARTIEMLGSDRYGKTADAGRAMTANDAVALGLDDEPRSSTAATSDRSAADLTQEGRMRLATGTRDDSDQAIALFEEAIRSDPRFAPAYMALSPIYRKRGWLGKELRLWRRRFEIAPEDPEASERIGWILWFTGHADQALPWLEKTVAQRPAGEWDRFYLGNAHLALRNYSEAERMYRTLLESHPDHSSAHAGVIWTLLAAGKDEAARAGLRQFQASSLDGDRYFLKVADLEHFLGEEESALLHARQALAEDPEQRFWPRGFCPSTIEGAILWSTDHGAAEAALQRSEQIDRERLKGGDEGYMPHIDLTAVHAIRGDIRPGCESLRAALQAGWRSEPLAIRDPLLRGLRGDGEFEALMASG